MIIDSSALIAILRDEAVAPTLVTVLRDAATRSISAGTLLEASIVADRPRDPVRSSRYDAMLEELDLEVIPVTGSQVRIARKAYRDFGRCSGHPANLNYGDCFSYALAAERREPLLYVGDHFRHTDIRSALAT